MKISDREILEMNDDEQGLFTISVVAGILGEHPETLRVWERNGLIEPDRTKYQRLYTNNDIARLKFIKYLIDEKGFNVASVSHLLKMYPCYYRGVICNGGGYIGNDNINNSKPCWKKNGAYCLKITDKSEMCCCCKRNKDKINKEDN